MNKTPQEIQTEIDRLNHELIELERKRLQMAREIGQIAQEIYHLQQQCQHSRTRDETVLDVAEYKMQRRCVCCRKII